MTPTPTPDHANRRQFERTVGPHMTALNKRAMRLARNPDDAADLMQTAMMRAWKFWHTFDPGTDARRWLFTVLRNTHATRWGQAKRRREVAGEHKAHVGVYGGPGPVEMAERSERVAMVREALATMRPDYADALRAVDLMGMSTAEAAAHLGVAPGTVNSRAYRGRKRLAAMLEGVA
jgi:RNA polymerase sigma-70 factor (ECF subfamily)